MQDSINCIFLLTYEVNEVLNLNHVTNMVQILRPCASVRVQYTELVNIRHTCGISCSPPEAIVRAMWQYVAFLFLVSKCQSFNVDVYEPIVRRTIQSENYDDPVNQDMFGYKVGLYNSTNGGMR